MCIQVQTSEATTKTRCDGALSSFPYRCDQVSACGPPESQAEQTGGTDPTPISILNRAATPPLRVKQHLAYL